MVIGTGAHTEIGKISTQLNEMGSIEDIPLTRKLNRLGYILGFIVIINLCVLISYKLILLAIQNQLFGTFISEALVSSILRSMHVMPINFNNTCPNNWCSKHGKKWSYCEKSSCY